MKQLLIVANWKENVVETTEWVDVLDLYLPLIPTDEKKVVICPPFTLLFEVKENIDARNLHIAVGSQTISEFASGAHTGEESGDMLKELVTYVIIGHSERRKMGETNEMVNEKIARAVEHGLIPIICVSNKEQTHAIQIPEQTKQAFVAFEPLDAIGTGKPENPEEANIVAGNIKRNVPNVRVLYGGSVNAENVHSFTSQELIDGVLVGGASLDPKAFSAIIQNS